ncbi:hypothetical protein R3P38DRAFT_1523554 [Favolaschia claudopus]|uniref:Uncharacterized protein n=1 Tax=Favolaschia claudopus TaxID=2862362 RepID=A0AAW0AJQ7_9AGAR
MFFASPFVSAALMMLGSVTALPQPENGHGGLMGRQSDCPSGSYRYNSTSCAGCPAGYTCNGGSDTPQSCDTGFYQPNMGSTSCIQTQPGFFTSQRASVTPSPCPAGSYQPYVQQAFCYGAPKGRFQQQSGRSFLCATCCGWAATLDNNNVNPVNCTGSKPNAWPNSGDGCISSQTSCVHAATCAQAADGTCPGETIRG